MQKKRFVVWTMIVALLLSLLPAGLSGTAQAAATFFIPDDANLAKTSTTVTNLNTDLVRSKVFVTTSNQMNINGTFQFVEQNSMTVKVEQLTYSAGNWVTDSNRTTTKGVTAASSNRFSATAVPLYAGYNRITFTGIQGGLNKNDIFYVLYDEVPYLSYLRVTAGTNPPAPLNQGVSMVVDSQQILLEGKAVNATRISVNGYQASPLEDGTFFAPAINLQPGLNTINLLIQNPANELKISRTIYYFDEDQPFNKIQILHNGDTATSILNNIPTLTGDDGNPATPEEGQLSVEMLVPYSAQPFNAANAAVQLNSTIVPINTVNSEIVIPGSDGVTPAYKIVDFLTDPYEFQAGAVAGTYAKSQSVTLDVYYSNYRGIITSAFKYLPGAVVINNVSLINDAPPTTGFFDINSTASLVPLNDVEVLTPEFYILVDANRNIENGATPIASPVAPTSLAATLLPLGTTNLTVEYVGDYYTAPAVVSPTKKVYKVSGLPSGNQKIGFRFGASEAEYQANVTYVSKNFISVDNLVDGQTIKINSKTIPVQGVDLKITGAYVGFDNLNSHELFVNGQPIAPFALSTGLNADKSFNNLQLQIGDTRSPLPLPTLSVGENRLVFTGVYQNGTSLSSITKEIRIYIVDENVPVIERFQPVMLPVGGRTALQNMPMAEALLSQIFLVTPDIQYVSEKYVTSLKSYDLAFKAGGVKTVTLRRGTDTVLSFEPPDATAPINTSVIATGSVPAYDITGSKDNFVVRIKNLQFDAPGSHVYTLELTNITGARVSQRLEIERVLEPFRILSPIPTVGDRIIVNKNFVRFDIEAEGATEVTINGGKATKRADFNERFIYDFIGLKADKETPIKVVINRPGGTLNQTVNVYYTSTIQVDSAYMEKIANKHSIFNKNLELGFPKGTILKSTNSTTGITQYYNNTNLLFGIADPADGVVERRNDYGNIINRDIDARTDARASLGQSVLRLPDVLVQRYNSEVNRRNFSRISPVYWISGGVGEEGSKGSATYKPATNGLTPYSVEGTFTLFPQTRKVVPTNRGTLTLKYDDSVVEAAGTMVTVFFFNDQGEWVNLGGEVDAKKNTITVPFDDFGYYMVTKLRYGFTDITAHPWARNVLEALFSKGVMPNLRFDTFGTDDLTTRGEFATLLVKALNIPLKYDNNPTFFEIGPGARSITWDYAHIETAARTGIVSGLDNRFFGADLKVTREQAATMIARALELKLAMNDDKLGASLAKSYTDASTFSFYARPAIEAVTKVGVMTGKPNEADPNQKKPTVRFDATANLTRAEAGQIAVRLLQKYTKVFPANLN